MLGDTMSYGFGQFIYRDSFEGIIGHSEVFGRVFNIFIKDLKNNRNVVVLTNKGRLLPIFEFGYAVQNCGEFLIKCQRCRLIWLSGRSIMTA